MVEATAEEANKKLNLNLHDKVGAGPPKQAAPSPAELETFGVTPDFADFVRTLNYRWVGGHASDDAVAAGCNVLSGPGEAVLAEAASDSAASVPRVACRCNTPATTPPPLALPAAHSETSRRNICCLPKAAAAPLAVMMAQQQQQRQ